MEIKEIIDSIAQDRPFFHLEADFQIALAGGIKEWISKNALQSKAKIYLEKKTGPKRSSMSVDIREQDWLCHIPYHRPIVLG